MYDLLTHGRSTPLELNRTQGPNLRTFLLMDTSDGSHALLDSLQPVTVSLFI